MHHLFALVADGDVNLTLGGLIGAIATAIPILALWLINIFRARAELGRTARSDAIAEWQTIVDRQQMDLASLRAKAESVEARLYEVLGREFECQKQHAISREQIARQEGVIQSLTNDVRRLQVINHDSPPAVTVPCILTASAADGLIRVASPASGPILGWLPQELVGQAIEVIVPPELRERHRAGLAAVAGGKAQTDAGRVIHTLALKRTGERVAVAINLFAWKTPMGSTMINADIRLDLSVQRTADVPAAAQ